MATNPDPWAQFNPQGPTQTPVQSPSAGPVYGAPAKPKEPKASYRPLTDDEAAQRGLPVDQKYQISSQGDVSPIAGTKVEGGVTSKPTEAQQKVGTLLSRIAGGFRDVQSVTSRNAAAQEPGLIETMRGGLEPEGITGPIVRGIAGEDRRMVYDSQRDVLDALLTLSTGAAYTKEQLAGQTASYFPAYGDTQDEIDLKNDRMRRLIEAAKINAGPQWKDIEAAIDPYMRTLGPKKEGEAPPALSGQIPGATHVMGDDAGEVIARDTYRTEDDPNLVAQGIRDEYARRLARGDNAAGLIAWAQQAGVHPSAFGSIAAQVKYRDKNPNVPISEYDTSKLDDRIIPISGAGQFINRIGRSPLGTYTINAGEAASGFNLDTLADLTGGNPEQVRRGVAASSAENPTAAALGTVSGGILTSLAGESMLARGGLTGIRGAMAADTGYGALAGAGMADYDAQGRPASMSDRFTGAATGAAAGLAGSFLGERAGRGVRSLASGVTSPAVQTIREAGIPMTMGQQFSQSGRVGEALKATEDRLAGLPIVGDIIQARRAEGIEAFNTAAFNRALKPIGGNVKGKVGEEAMVAADDLVSQAYDKALKGKSAPADAQFEKELSRAVEKTLKLPRVGDEVTNGIATILEPYADGAVISGEAMQQISRELRALKASYRNDPLYNRIGSSIDAAEDSIFGMFRRNTPDVVPDYENARKAARRLYILEDAVLKGKNTGGVFTPAQLGIAERTSMKRFEGSRAASKGEGPFADIQRAAQDVLPGKIPDSGTAGRWILPALLLGGGAGVDTATGTSGTGLTIGALMAGAYSKAGQRLLTKPGRGVKSQTLRQLMESGPTGRVIQAGAAAGGVSALPNQQ